MWWLGDFEPEKGQNCLSRVIKWINKARVFRKVWYKHRMKTENERECLVTNTEKNC